ncbi:MAG: cell division protein FtsA, partial [Phenylobacterium zucineum]
MAGKKVDPAADASRLASRAPVVAALDLGQSKVACFIMKPDGVRHADR